MTAQSENPTTAVSAPGKVLLAGGYLVTDRDYTGLVFGLDARINVVARGIPTSQGVQLTEIVVESPQFVGGIWRYGYHLAPEDGGITVTQLQVGSSYQPNPFIETTLTYALTYISRVVHQRPAHSIKSARLTILADTDYYSASPSPSAPSASPSGNRFVPFGTSLKDAKKTGLGSSAALVTSLTAALLSHYLDPIHFDLATDKGRTVLHNLAQAAHCRAQGKIGSGFDVAAAVHGSCLYRRFSPSVLDAVPQPRQPHFGTRLEEAVGGSRWDTEVHRDKVSLPRGVAMRMVDVECGSQTVGMVKAVNAWRAADPDGSRALWDELQGRNEALARVLADGRVGDLPAALAASRELVRAMGARSEVPIEPESQTELIDALSAVDGVYGGVVPGAGGFDAVALLVRDDEETAARVERFLEDWSAKKKDSKVKLLGVKGELEGVRVEKLREFDGWLS
ncbi:putative phosphomevalonate kinase [Diaporthe ampelina]|uniref:Phosphomevalonate kinase n=1 Tax=Diaporthe ampelina TaxID=1214573 RepID=A0A0G2HNW3_9PEZI|nr:putative phosphomevalonate kinase [Diaporthe ampelina]